MRVRCAIVRPFDLQPLSVAPLINIQTATGYRTEQMWTDKPTTSRQTWQAECRPLHGTVNPNQIAQRYATSICGTFCQLSLC